MGVYHGMNGDHTLPEFPKVFTGQTAVITGGGTGIGKAIALKLAGLGANIVIASRKHEHFDLVVETIRSRGGNAIAVAMDVRK